MTFSVFRASRMHHRGGHTQSLETAVGTQISAERIAFVNESPSRTPPLHATASRDCRLESDVSARNLVYRGEMCRRARAAVRVTYVSLLAASRSRKACAALSAAAKPARDGHATDAPACSASVLEGVILRVGRRHHRRAGSPSLPPPRGRDWCPRPRAARPARRPGRSCTP